MAAPKLDHEQESILDQILSIGAQVKATPMEILSAVETGLVESDFHNSPAMTDHDSQGWRQERASLYPDPTNLDHSIHRYFAEARAVRGKFATAGDLAAAVQRPAKEYRGRYGAAAPQARALIDEHASGPLSPATNLTDAQAGATAGTGAAADQPKDEGWGTGLFAPILNGVAKGLLYVALIVGGAILVGLGARKSVAAQGDRS